jgi:hypothetical protein
MPGDLEKLIATFFGYYNPLIFVGAIKYDTISLGLDNHSITPYTPSINVKTIYWIWFKKHESPILYFPTSWQSQLPAASAG